MTIWAPVLDHYRVSGSDISDAMVEASRQVPQDSLLDAIESLSTVMRPWSVPDHQLVRAAEAILQGRDGISGTAPMAISVPFSVDDLEKGSPAWQLEIASFKIPSVLLSAYKLTGREVFLRTARDVILAWARYERRVWVPRGLLWNDHAIAARVLVLAEFWRIYRACSLYGADDAKTVLQLVARSAQLLAKESHFAFSTNHGVMQNLALWHICLGFPFLPDVEQYKQLALIRMKKQMLFYVNDEGVVLEHSAGYHAFGVKLVGMALKYAALLHLAIPVDWREKYEKASDFLVQMRRPDGSLPTIGDTVASWVTNQDRESQRRRSRSLYPVAGYAIWWDEWRGKEDHQELSQTVVSWSHFPGHGHRRANEMSVTVWGSGHEWLTSVGYWPYGVAGRSAAEGWSGSNAPHLVAEGSDSLRSTQVSAFGWSDGLAAIDLQRNGPQKYVVRRQVISLKPGIYLVIDSTSNHGVNSRTTVAWTTSPEIRWMEGTIPGSSVLRGTSDDARLHAFLSGSHGMEIRRFAGSSNPFAGWKVIDWVPTPTNSVVVEHAVGSSWAMAIWSFPRFAAQPSMSAWHGEKSWRVSLPLEMGTLTILREGNTIHVDGNSDASLSRRLTMEDAPDISQKLRELRAWYRECENDYPRFKDYIQYRWRVTYVLMIVLSSQEIFFFLHRLFKWRYRSPLLVLNLCGWASVGTWLIVSYFKP